MKTILFKKLSVLTGILAISLVLFTNSCKKFEYQSAVTNDVNIGSYLENNPQFSLMAQILKRSGTAGYLNAYGAYTLFAPTNDAINEWLKTQKVSSVDEVPVDSLTKMVKFHLIMDTLSTQNFIDGKLRRITTYGQYLLTHSINEGGVTSFYINRTAKVIGANRTVGNGIIHEINKVLVPEKRTLARIIAENPRYSIFTKALIETGFYDSLNYDPAALTDSTRKFQTVILESDSAIQAAGYANYDKLQEKLSPSNTPKVKTDSLWLYVAYHIGPNGKYLSDILSTASLGTLAPNQVVTTKFQGQSILLNEVEFNGKLEPGVAIERSNSDVTASNGVLHESRSFYRIKKRVPFPLYWDLGNLEGVKTHPLYGKGVFDLLVNQVHISPDFRQEAPNKNYSRYQWALNNGYNANPPQFRNFNLDDGIYASTSGATNRSKWIEFRTPLLVAGRYKMWICYNAQGNGHAHQVIINPGTNVEQVMPVIVNFSQNLGTSGATLTNENSDAVMEGAGYKRYIATVNDRALSIVDGTIINGNAPVAAGNPTGRLVGIVNIRTTDRHWIRFVNMSTSGGANQNQWLDMIHFIPETMSEQQYPRFHRTGTQFNRVQP